MANYNPFPYSPLPYSPLSYSPDSFFNYVDSTDPLPAPSKESTPGSSTSKKNTSTAGFPPIPPTVDPSTVGTQLSSGTTLNCLGIDIVASKKNTTLIKKIDQGNLSIPSPVKRLHEKIKQNNSPQIDLQQLSLSLDTTVSVNQDSKSSSPAKSPKKFTKEDLPSFTCYNTSPNLLTFTKQRPLEKQTDQLPSYYIPQKKEPIFYGQPTPPKQNKKKPTLSPSDFEKDFSFSPPSFSRSESPSLLTAALRSQSGDFS